jgi:hypothetical protein
MFAGKTMRFYFTPKLQTRLESIARDKHSSLFGTFVKDAEKGLNNISGRENTNHFGIEW